MRLRLVGDQLDGHHGVGGVSGGGQRARAQQRLVRRTLVEAGREAVILFRLHVDYCHFCEKFCVYYIGRLFK